MTPSSGSFITAGNSLPLFTSSSSSPSTTFLRAREPVAEDRSVFPSSHGLNLTPSSLFQISEHISSPPFVSVPCDLSPVELLNSSYYQDEESFKRTHQHWSLQQQTCQTVRDHRRTEDGYNWRKYGQKQVKCSENRRSYYKCSSLNCPTKKKVERTLDGHITEIIFKGTHNHPLPKRTRRNSSSLRAYHHEGQENHLNRKFGAPTDSNMVVENISTSLGDEDVNMNFQRDEDEQDAKIWRMEGENEGIFFSNNRTVREPKVVVQTTSEIDILDDGYRWRKYGQKVVKGNPNPRSYYKCTSPGCPVRKLVERASTDLRMVITTYEGKHNHDVPIPRGSGRLLNLPLFDDVNSNSTNNNNNNNNSIYNMNNYFISTKPSIISHPGQLVSNSFFDTRANGLNNLELSRYENSMNSLYANQIHNTQKKGDNMLSKGNELRDDLFIDSLLFS